MDIRNVPIISNRDKLLFEYLNVFKLLDINFVKKHIYNHRSQTYVYSRIKQLEYHGYIKSIILFELNSSKNNTNQKKIIFNSKNAEEFLEFHLFHTNKVNNISNQIINHQLFLAHSLVYFYDEEISVASNTNVQVERLVSENELSLARKDYLRPDGGVIFSINDQNILVFVEAERSYAKLSDVSRKLVDQYGNIFKYASKLKVVEEEDIKALRIMFVSENRNKMMNIIEKTNNVMKRRKDFSLSKNIIFTCTEDIEKIMRTNGKILSLLYYTLSGYQVKIYEPID